MPFWRRRTEEPAAPEREVGEPVDPDFVDPSWEPDPADFGDPSYDAEAPSDPDTAIEPEAPGGPPDAAAAGASDWIEPSQATQRAPTRATASGSTA